MYSVLCGTQAAAFFTLQLHEQGPGVHRYMTIYRMIDGRVVEGMEISDLIEGRGCHQKVNPHSKADVEQNSADEIIVEYSYQFYLSMCCWEEMGKEECFEYLFGNSSEDDYDRIATVEDRARLHYRWDNRVNQFTPVYEGSRLNEVRMECISEIDPGLPHFIRAFGKEVMERRKSGNRCQRASVEYILEKVAEESE